jgi:hypothetical protein
MSFYLSLLVLYAGGLPATGPFKVERTVQQAFESQPGRIVKLEVWKPGGVNRGPFPLLLFSPGLGNKPSQYESQLEDLASHGYIVAALEHPAGASDALAPLASLWAQDILAAKRETLGSSLREIIDGRKIGAFGHSLGGRAAAGACQLDTSILACLNQDGGDDDVQLRRPYWPQARRTIAGTFAMLDWFDPGISDEDLRAMSKTREQYAASRLEPTRAALDAYRAAQRGALRITILSPGMRHTAFTDDLWSGASTSEQRTRFGDYLLQVREITLRFFGSALNGTGRNSLCNEPVKDTLTQCFTPETQPAPR